MELPETLQQNKAKLQKSLLDWSFVFKNNTKRTFLSYFIQRENREITKTVPALAGRKNPTTENAARALPYRKNRSLELDRRKP